MRLRLGVPSVTLGGLLKHLAWVEELYFQDLLSGRNPMAPFEQLDIERDRGDWPWNTASDDAPDDLRALWLDTVHQSRDALTGASVPRRDGADDPRRHVTPPQGILVEAAERSAFAPAAVGGLDAVP
jgi:hypothetical protein